MWNDRMRRKSFIAAAPRTPVTIVKAGHPQKDRVGIGDVSGGKISVKVRISA